MPDALLGRPSQVLILETGHFGCKAVSRQPILGENSESRPSLGGRRNALMPDPPSSCGNSMPPSPNPSVFACAGAGAAVAIMSPVDRKPRFFAMGTPRYPQPPHAVAEWRELKDGRRTSLVCWNGRRDPSTVGKR